MDVEAESYQNSAPYWESQNTSHVPAHYHSFYHSFEGASPQQPPLQSSEHQQQRPTFAATDPTIRNGSKKRRACNECKQQKLRCDLSTLVNPTTQSCSRCKRLGLECRIDRSFRRERKRKRSDELEKEVDSLKQELYKRSNSAQASSGLASHYDTAGSDAGSSSSIATFPTSNEILLTHLPNMTPPDSTHGSEYPATMTAPFQDEGEALRRDLSNLQFGMQGGCTLGRVHLSVDTVDLLFTEYFANYHPFLPILDPVITPDRYLGFSSLLFWAIISVASRRWSSDPTLLSRLARPVTDLTWKTLQTVPRSRYGVQALALLCTWPFPINSSTADVSYLWAGSMMHISIQLGLHRPLNLQDFSKGRVAVNDSEVCESVRTWAACNIVAQSVSFGQGLTSPVQSDRTLASGSRSGLAATILDPTLDFHLRIEMLRDQVTRAMTSSPIDPSGLLPIHERTALYTVFSQQLEGLTASVNNLSEFDYFYVLSARFHLQSFCLFDEPSSDFYTERVLALYFTAISLIQHSLAANSRSRNTIRCCPFYSVQTFIAASFILLKILKSDYFTSFIPVESGRELFHEAVNSIKTMSVADNDLPSRFADVLSYIWTDAPPHLITGPGKQGLKLRVRSRNSMSIVYDSLWRWREHFAAQSEQQTDDGEDNEPELSESSADSAVGAMEDHQQFGMSSVPFAFFGPPDYALDSNPYFGLIN